MNCPVCLRSATVTGSQLTCFCQFEMSYRADMDVNLNLNNFTINSWSGKEKQRLSIYWQAASNFWQISSYGVKGFEITSIATGFDPLTPTQAWKKLQRFHNLKVFL